MLFYIKYIERNYIFYIHVYIYIERIYVHIYIYIFSYLGKMLYFPYWAVKH